VSCDELIWPIKDPDEALDYDIDVVAALPAADGNIVTATAVILPVTVPPLAEDAAATIDNTNRRVKYFFSGGLDGTDYEIVCTITTDSTPARTLERTIVLPVKVR